MIEGSGKMHAWNASGGGSCLHWKSHGDLGPELETNGEFHSPPGNLGILKPKLPPKCVQIAHTLKKGVLNLYHDYFPRPLTEFKNSQDPRRISQWLGRYPEIVSGKGEEEG